MSKIKFSALLTMGISLLISLVSGYCTVIGMGKVFASAAAVTMGIAIVIEIGRVILLYDLHHFWHQLKLFQKIPGVLMLLIAMTLSAMGVYGFFANAHSQKAQQIIPIEMVIKQKQSEIDILNQVIENNNTQLKQFDNKAADRFTELGYVSKAVALQKEQQKITNNIYADNREKQTEITKLNQEITQLKLEAEQKAPTLAHLKYYAKLFHVDDETAVIIFIVMIMTVFDTLAMYLMITSDWIMNLGKEEQENIIKNEVKDLSSIYDKLNNKIMNNIQQALEKNNQKEDNVNIEELKSLIQNITNSTQPQINEVMEKVDSIKHIFHNNTLLNKLTEIENKINDLNNIDNEDDSDILYTKLNDMIYKNPNSINTDYFKRKLENHPEVLLRLKISWIKNEQIIKLLNKF